MACNTCHPHPPIDGAFGYSELWVAVNTFFYDAREAIEKWTKQDSPTTNTPGTITLLPEIVPNFDDGDGLRFIAEDGGFGLAKGPWEFLGTGSADKPTQHYAGSLRYSVTDRFKLDLSFIRTGAGQNAEEVFDLGDFMGGSTLIPGFFTEGFWKQTGPGQTEFIPPIHGADDWEHNGSNTFYLGGSYCF